MQCLPWMILVLEGKLLIHRHLIVSITKVNGGIERIIGLLDRSRRRLEILMSARNLDR